MAPETSTRLTYQDYLELPDDGKRYEIIDGELYVNPAPNVRHQRIVRVVFRHLDRYFEDHGSGEVLTAPTDVVFDDEDITQPDLLVVKSDRAGVVTEKNLQGAPNIAIEVLSDGTRRKDEILKRKLYERAGVDEYWIIDPAIDLVKIYRRGDSGYIRAAELSAETGGSIASPLLPGFSLDVQKVFAV